MEVVASVDKDKKDECNPHLVVLVPSPSSPPCSFVDMFMDMSIVSINMFMNMFINMFMIIGNILIHVFINLFMFVNMSINTFKQGMHW